MLSLLLVGWSLLNAYLAKVSMSMTYSIYVCLLQIPQMSLYTYLMVDDRASNFKITYHIMGLRRNLYIAGQSISFIVQGLLLNCLLYAVGIGINLYRQEPLISTYDLSLFALAFAFVVSSTFFSILMSFMFKDPAVSKDLSILINLLLFIFTFVLHIYDRLMVVQMMSPYAPLIVFASEFITSHQLIIPSLVPGIYYSLGQIVVYFVLAIYLENVIGGDDDHSKHPLYFLDYFKPRDDKADVRQMSNAILAERDDTDIECDRNGLTVYNLSKNFGDFSALKSVSVNFSSGQMHCMLGHNGAGKSTFINILTGMYKSSSGHIFYKGENLIDLHKSESTKINIGVCPPNDIVFPSLTVFQHLKMMCYIKNLEDHLQKITSVMRQLNITDYADYNVSQLSGGNRRKLTIALSLIGGPNLLFLDEPTSALDPVSRKDIWRILQDIKSENKDMITILTTHHLEEAEFLADNIVVLAGGTIKFKGTINEIKKGFGIGYVLQLISNELVSPTIFEQFIKSVNDSLQTNAILLDSCQINERRLEIRIGLSQIKHINKLIGAIKENVPPDMIFTVNSNTLESAYIEIDKDLHKDSKINSQKNLSAVLSRLYTHTRSSAFKLFTLVLSNKFLFLSTNFYELFKTLATYILLGSGVGLAVYILHDKKVTFIIDYIRPIFITMIIVELFMSSFSVLNFVYDQSKDLKFILFVNKVTPKTYYAGKLMADFILVTVCYSILFSVFYATLREDMITIEGATDIFMLLCFKVYMWRLCYSCVGALYYRVFSNPKAVLSYYSLMYLGINLVIVILQSFVCKYTFYLNDYALIIKIINKDDIGYLHVFLSFFILAAVHVFIALFLENRALRFNFVNGRIEKKNYNENSEEIDFIDTVNEIQSKLRKTIKKEIEETLSFEPKMIKVIDLKKQYNSTKIALNEVTFSIAETTQFGLIGPNGAGKSTLFNILLGKVFKTSGSVFMNNAKEFKGVLDYMLQENPYESNQYGVCFQGDSTWEQLKVIDNLRFFIGLHNINEDALMELLEYFEFKHYLQKRAIDLSSGNKRKLCIIISLLINPNIILFDEATCGVDLYMRMRLKFIFQHFYNLNKSTAVFTTHFLKDIEVFCDKIGIISQGQFLCIDYIHNIKQILGGYFAHLYFNDLASKDRVFDALSKFAAIKITHNDDENRIIKCIFNRVISILDLFNTLLALEEAGTLSEFSINQLSIEDIYLDVFNRSE